MAQTKFNFNQTLGNAIWYPTDTAGATNMASELEAFIVAHPGRVVEILSGSTILLEGFGTGFATLPTDIHIRAHGVTILQTNSSRCIDLDNTGNISAEYSVSAIADDTTQHTGNLSSTKITLTSTSGALAHDFVAVYSTDAYPGSSGVLMGEISQLVKDEASDILYTTGTLSRTAEYTAGNTKVRVLSKAQTFSWEGGTFQSNGDTDDLLITDRQEVFRINGYVGPTVKDVSFDSPWAQMVWFQTCARGLIEGIKVYDTLNNASASGFSYGAYFYGMNYGHVVRDMHVFNGRHPGYTSGSDASPSSWYEYGYPTYCTIDSVIGHNCYGALIDTHEEGADHTFINCIAYNSYEDEREAFDGRLAQSRAIRDRFINCHAFYGCGGITIDNINHGFENVVRIENCTFEGIQNNTTSARAIDFDNQAAAGRLRVELENVKIKDSDKGIEVGKYIKMSYSNLKFTNVDECILARDGSVSYGTNMTCDFIDTSYPTFSKVWDIYSDDADTYVTCLGENIVIKNTANIPREWFAEGDSAANVKYVYHSGITDCKSVDATAAATATLSKESGATTFTDLTTVATVSL